MDSNRIKEIQETTAYPQSVSVQKALLQVWNECAAEMYSKANLGLKEPKQEIVGYRLKPSIDRKIIDVILKNSMPIWNQEDKSVYFIRGHIAGSLVAKMKELQVLDLWFTPIYEFEEVKSDWLKQNHLDYYYKEGIMNNEPKQEPTEEAKQRAKNYMSLKGALEPKQETIEEAAETYADFSNDYVPLEFGENNFNETAKRNFIEGAKSDAAKYYWYAKWQQEQNDTSKVKRVEVKEIKEIIKSKQP